MEMILPWSKTYFGQEFPEFPRGSKGVRMSKYHFPIIPKPVEVFLPWSKAISHKNSQNSQIPGIPKGE